MRFTHISAATRVTLIRIPALALLARLHQAPQLALTCLPRLHARYRILGLRQGRQIEWRDVRHHECLSFVFCNYFLNVLYRQVALRITVGVCVWQSGVAGMRK